MKVSKAHTEARGEGWGGVNMEESAHSDVSVIPMRYTFKSHKNRPHD